MPNTYDVEVWIVSGLQVNGFNGPNAFQNAKDWCINNPLSSGEYGIYVTADGSHWVGPRGGRP